MDRYAVGGCALMITSIVLVGLMMGPTAAAALIVLVGAVTFAMSVWDSP